ncbi:MAG TPA: hypothetical protein VFY16_11760 [Gemmatimonadaceae bacterium]|nr:hypothetical protein [Gemmatimonadaceae bacterium]
MSIRHWSAALVVASLTLACDRRSETATRGGEGSAAAPAQDTAAGMAGMGHAMASGPMMERMDAHLVALEKTGPDSLAAALPAHRQMVANLIAQMNREMRDMDMTGDPAWNATVDSLRQDLVRLPEASAAELRELMPAHRSRVQRLTELHRRMMASM